MDEQIDKSGGERNDESTCLMNKFSSGSQQSNFIVLSCIPILDPTCTFPIEWLKLVMLAPS